MRHTDVTAERRIVTFFHAHRALSTWKLAATQSWYSRVLVHHDFTGRFNAAHIIVQKHEKMERGRTEVQLNHG